MGDFGRKIDRFIEIFVEQRGYVRVLEGLQNTVMIAVVGLLVGVLIGTLIASVRVMPKYKLLPRVLNGICSFYVGLFRGTPMVVQLLGVLLCTASTYGSAYDRCAGIYACLWLEQWSLYFRDDACVVLSPSIRDRWRQDEQLVLAFRSRMIKIVIPQAVKNILPTLGNEFIALVKETSVVSFVGAADLYVAFNYIGTNSYEFMVPYLVMALIYIVTCTFDQPWY